MSQPAAAFAPLHVPPLPRPKLAPRAVRLGLTMAAVAAATLFAFALDRKLDHPAMWFALSALGASAFLLHVRHIGAQLITRGVWWSYLILGFVVAIEDRRSPGLLLGAMAVMLGVALLVANAQRTGDIAGGFAPRAFKQTLTVGLILAVADTQCLTFWSLVRLERGRDYLPLVLCTLLMLVALWGLYHQKVWGVVVNVFANVVIACLAMTETLRIEEPLNYALVATAIVQVVLLLPVLFALVDGREPRPTEEQQRTGRFVATVVLVVLTAGSALGALDFIDL